MHRTKYLFIHSDAVEEMKDAWGEDNGPISIIQEAMVLKIYDVEENPTTDVILTEIEALPLGRSPSRSRNTNIINHSRAESSLSVDFSNDSNINEDVESSCPVAMANPVGTLNVQRTVSRASRH